MQYKCYVPFHDICPSQPTSSVLVNARQKVPTYHHRYRSREYGEENKHISALMIFNFLAVLRMKRGLWPFVVAVLSLLCRPVSGDGDDVSGSYHSLEPLVQARVKT